MILPDNDGHRVAMQSLLRDLGVGVFWREIEDLTAELSRRATMRERRDRMWDERRSFTFDAHADDLIELFRGVITKG